MNEEHLSEDQVPGVGQIRVDVSSDTVAAEARLSGELDIATIGQVHATLAQLRADGIRFITLDLGGLRFLSASGLGVLVREANELERAGGSLVLKHPTNTVRRALAITRLDALVVE